MVQDKLWVPGLMKLKTLRDLGFFGKILSVRGEFGYWVFEGDTIPAQRPSWNYRKADGGGIIIDPIGMNNYFSANVLTGNTQDLTLDRSGGADFFNSPPAP